MKRKEEVHGMSYSKTYRIWKNMCQRCINPKSTGYELYGGRGIKVCKTWLDSFNQFRTDVGDCPSDKHQIDRINVNGNYEPGNVRWATPKTQMRNQRPRKNTQSKYKGVRVHPINRKKRYQATITIDYKTISLGYYLTEEEAALAYNKAAVLYFKEDAHINILPNNKSEEDESDE